MYSYYWFSITRQIGRQLLLLVILITPSCTWAQLTLDQQEANALPYVYKLKILSGKKQVGTMTAFKIAGYDGLLTALHGLTVPSVTLDNLNFVAVRFSKKGDGRITEVVKDNLLQLQGINVPADLAFIGYKPGTQKSLKLWTKSEGLIPANANYKVKGGELVRVVGYPGIDELIGRDRNTEAPVLFELGSLITPESYRKLGERQSPGLKQTVINLGPTAIFSGDSGGPVFNRMGEVVGVANGGDYNQRDRLRSWAILPLPQNIPANGLSNDQKEDFKRLSGPGMQILMSDTNIPEHEYSDNETPRLTIGGTLSRPLWFSNEGIRLGAYNQLNAAFDAYVETRLKEKWLGGLYVSSRYLQYQVTQKSAHNLPPPNGERQQHQGPTIDLYGLQISHIWHRGTVHNAYIGAGGLYVPDRFFNDYKDARLLNNARIFTGYRLYLGPKRNLGLELRAAWIHQNIKQDLIIRRLGIGDVIPDQLIPLNQWYLCGGLTYSFYRHQ
ncbi:S1 family peptidase [Spirosoma spitsbergense]|uniref:S1 family peptidase n=1 Tax=Spirosoma spitsbergense TaxID=431554 RepID=UPI0003739C49|nr:serine protease [Spirosoma spitsbergense]